jgi:hypothetical protein
VDIKQFLESILPTEGTYCVGTLKNKVFQNFFGDTIGWAAEIAAGIDSRQRDAYFALSSFKGKGSRTQDSVLWVKSFWLDIDTQESKPNEPYASRKVAVQELRKFCAAVGLTPPTLVSSGYGIHAYWPLTENVDGVTWKGTATLLKQACRVWGLAADSSRTSDSASVLRPVGMRNFKMDAPKEVKLLTSVDPIEFSRIHDALVAYLTANKAMPTVPLPRVENINSDLMTQPTALPSSGHRIAKHCAVIQKLRDTAGDLPQPEWYYGLQVVAFTEEGDALCHEWSMGHPQYDARETQAKIDQAKQYAPTSCQKLREYNESACSTCPHFGKIKSPIVLGTEKHEPQYIQVPGAAASPDQPHRFLPMMPKGFGWGPIKDEPNAKHVLWATKMVKVEGDDGSVKWEQEREKITDCLFFPIERIRDDSRSHSMLMCVYRPDGTQDEFTIDNSLAVDSRELQKELARREIVIMNNAENHLRDYLKSWITELRDNHRITPASKQFGWSDDGMIVGDEYITPAETRKAILSGSARKYGEWMKPKGDLDTWIDLIHKLYDYPNLAFHQFVILCSFAAPLWKMTRTGGGIAVYAHSGDGSHGKTTAQQAAVSVWGDGWDENKLILSTSQFTKNSLYDHVGIMKNLPAVLDEMTDCSAEFASEFVYTTSSGAGKRRLGQDATLKDTLDWSTIVMGSGNNYISEKIATVTTNPTARLMRLWEFHIQDNLKFDISVNQFNDLSMQIKDHYGLAGPIYAKYLVENQDKIAQRLMEVRSDFVQAANIQPKERFWSALHACVLTALEITNELGLLRFKREIVMDWIINELRKSRGNVVESVTSPVEQFSHMIAAFIPNILVTVGQGNLHKSVNVSARIEHQPRGELIGRHILPEGAMPEKMYVSVGAARDWCQKVGASWTTVKNEMVKEGIVQKDEERISLGKGVREYSAVVGAVRCISVNVSKLYAKGSNLGLQPVVQAVPSAPSSNDSVDMTGTA